MRDSLNTNGKPYAGKERGKCTTSEFEIRIAVTFGHFAGINERATETRAVRGKGWQLYNRGVKIKNSKFRRS